MSSMEVEVKFQPPNGEEQVILLRWLVGLRARVVSGQPLALFHSPLLGAPPPLISSSAAPMSSSLSSSSLANLLTTPGETQALLQQQVIISPSDGVVSELAVQHGEIVTAGRVVCRLRRQEGGATSSGSPTKAAEFGVSSEQLRGRDTLGPSKPRFQYDPVAISQEIRRLDRKRRNLELDLRRKVPEEEYEDESNPIVLRYVTLDKELSARQTERRRELLDIVRILKHRYDFLRSDRSTAVVDVAALAHLCNDMPQWPIAPLRHTIEAGDLQQTKDILLWDGPDDEERDGEHAGHFLARATSTYPWLQSTDEREGDPICDYMAAHLYENRFILAIADGCSWGANVAAAARKAATTFVRCVARYHETFRNTQELGHCLLQGLAEAHYAIMNNELDIFDSGTSTLLGGVLLQLTKLDDQGQNTWAFVFVSVGDCVARQSLVSLGNGLCRPVESVAAGDAVAAWCPTSGRIDPADSVATYCTYKGSKRCVRLQLATGDSLTLTPDHRVLATTCNDRAALTWLPAGQLTASHQLLRCLTVEAVDQSDSDDDDDKSFCFAGWSLRRHRDCLLALARLAAVLGAGCWSLDMHAPLDDWHIQRDVQRLGGSSVALLHTVAAFRHRLQTAGDRRLPSCLLREYRAAQLGHCASLAELLAAARAHDTLLHFARSCGVRYSTVKERFIALLVLYQSSASLLPHWLDNNDYATQLCSALLPGQQQQPGARASLPCPDAASAWSVWLRALDVSADCSSLLVPLAGGPVELDAPLPVYDISVPGRENFTANGFVVHNCKAFIWSRATRKITDLTENSRSELLDPRDCGGRIGPYYHTGQPDLRNLAVFCAPCFEGDMLILCSDGVHDNLDPVLLGLSPADLELTEEKWDDVDPVVLSELKNRYRCEFLQSRIFGNLTKPSPTVVASRIINHCVETTTSAREFLERDPEANLPINDYANYPGKMDHTTCMCVTATSIPREPAAPAVAPSTPKKPNIMRSTSSRLTTSFRTGGRKDKTTSFMVDTPPLQLAKSKR